VRVLVISTATELHPSPKVPRELVAEVAALNMAAVAPCLRPQFNVTHHAGIVHLCVPFALRNFFSLIALSDP
jgi:hypothetical protein